MIGTMLKSMQWLSKGGEIPRPTDQNSMMKAMRLRASRNLVFSQGTTPPLKSFLSFPNSRVNSNLESLGVRLGRNSEERLVSVNVLKNVEVDRFEVAPKNKFSDHLAVSDLDEDEVYASYDDQLLSHLVGDVSDQVGFG